MKYYIVLELIENISLRNWKIKLIEMFKRKKTNETNIKNFFIVVNKK